ncbi:MAG: ArsR family transcriptional regulator [Acidobacteria bacterium ACB1]|nr:Transcriptional repressor SdpR [Pyrinomonadaceae bacterium]MCE7961000.1 ArsR family transcriptional regulator [Acidobacteria bacterium ACB1]RIJ90025.1 MAG: ArsR family transcriptional regulator [Acidobacteriota bacterium]
MDAFAAIAEPNRRKILELLAAVGSLAATDIYGRFGTTHAAVSQHLKILREAGLVNVEKRKQQRIYSINSSKMTEFEAWVKRFTQKTDEAFTRLDEVLQAEMKKKKGEK